MPPLRPYPLPCTNWHRPQALLWWHWHSLIETHPSPEQRLPTPTCESGQIEQDADAIILLSGDNPDKYLFRLSKNKEGEIGDLPITFNKQIQRFQEYTWMD